MKIDDLTKQKIHDAQQGDSRAFEFLYNTFFKEVYSIARYILKSDSKAEDVLQETFIKVYYKLPELKNAEAFSSWLYMITQNECRMVMRKKDENLLYMNIQDEEYALLADADPVIPFGQFEKEDDRLFVKKEVEKLPIHHRMVIVYFYYLNMPVKEIAKLLSCNENTIKSRLFAGRTLLKKGIAKVQEQLGTPLVFAVLPLTQIAGNNILEQSISKNAAKAIFLSVSGSVGAGMGQVGIFWRLKNFVKRATRKIAGPAAILAVLFLTLGITGIVAATAMQSAMFSLSRDKSELNSGQVAETAASEVTNREDTCYTATISPANPAREPTIVPTPGILETTSEEQEEVVISVLGASLKVAESPSPEPSGTTETVPVQEVTPSPSPSPSPTTAPTPTAAPTAAPTPEPPTPTAAPTLTPPTPTITAVPTPTPEPTIPDTPTAGEIASTITEITSPALSDVYLTLPAVPAGYSIAIKSSSDEGVIALDGKVTPLAALQNVEVVLTITKTINHTAADTVKINVAVPRVLSSSTELLLSSDEGTKLAGAVVKEDTSITHQDGMSESKQTLLIVTINSADIASANFLPVVDHATVTAATATGDAGAGGVKSGDYVSITTNTFNFTSNKFLWIKVVSEDLTSTRYYSLYVKS